MQCKQWRTIEFDRYVQADCDLIRDREDNMLELTEYDFQADNALLQIDYDMYADNAMLRIEYNL